MVDPTKKPAQAPPTEPAAQPATTRGSIKHAQLVFSMFSCILALPRVTTLHHFDSWV